MDPPGLSRCMDPIKKGDIPASYVVYQRVVSMDVVRLAHLVTWATVDSWKKTLSSSHLNWEGT